MGLIRVYYEDANGKMGTIGYFATLKEAADSVLHFGYSLEAKELAFPITINSEPYHGLKRILH